MKLQLRRGLILLVICLAIPAILFTANLVVVYNNFPFGEAFKKLTLTQFAERSGYRPLPRLRPAMDSNFESFRLSNGFASAVVCELCSRNRKSCHRDLAKEAQRWLRHTFEQGPAWAPMKPLQPALMSLALERRYDDEELLKIIVYSRLMHSNLRSLDELCIRTFKFQCELLTLDQNLQVNIATIAYAYTKTKRFDASTLRKRLDSSRLSCGLKIK